MEQRSFLDGASERRAEIAGLRYLPRFVSVAEEQGLLGQIDASPWLADLKRRVQHYGFKYDYKARRADASMRIGPFPEWLAAFSERLLGAGIFAAIPDQAIVNEYLPGQGIAAHVDCEPCFGETVASLSLGSSVSMSFDRPETGEARAQVLDAGSLLVLTGEARHAWRHGIAPRRNDPAGFARGRRVSITFRTVILAARSPRARR